MADNGVVARFQALRAFVNDPGGVAILVLAFLLSMLAGWIPSPITRVEAKLDVHEAGIAVARATRAATDAKLADILTRLTNEIEKQNKRDRIRECAQIADRELRLRCLD